MNRALKKSLTLIISSLLGLVILWHLIKQQDPQQLFTALTQFGVWPLVGFIGLSLLNFLLYSLRWQMIVNKHTKQKLSLKTIFLHRMTGFAVSYLTPAAQVGGEPARIAMLMSEGVPSKQATSSVALDITIELIAYISFLIAGTILAIVTGVDVGTAMYLAVFILTLLLLFLISIPFFLRKRINLTETIASTLKLSNKTRLQPTLTWLKETEQLMHAFMQHRLSFLNNIALLAITVISFRIVEVFYIAWFFGEGLSFAQAFLVATLPGIALLLPVPGGVGVFEGSFAAVFSVLNIPIEAIAFALIIRARDLVFIGIGVIHALTRGGSWMTKQSKNNR